MDAITNTQASSRGLVEQYFAHTNQVLGITGFGFALGCVGLDLPSLCAWACIIFLVIVWGDNLESYRRHINALRAAAAPEVRWYAMLWRTRIAILGWLALGCVACGIVDQHGIVVT